MSGHAFGVDTTPPAIPTGLAATAGTGSVTLTWSPNAESDLAGYRVYRNGAASPLNSTLLTGASYADSALTNGITYSYAVTAVDTSGNESARSATVTATPSAGTPSDPVLITAGDIASCSWSGDAATATLVKAIPGTVLTLGDNVYQNGTAAEFSSCYQPTWGQFKSRTRPDARKPRLQHRGRERLLRLLQRCRQPTGPAGDRSARLLQLRPRQQLARRRAEQRVRDDGRPLAQGRVRGRFDPGDLVQGRPRVQATENNIIVTWHKPRFSSSTEHGNNTHMQGFWQIAYDGGVDLVLNGHSHNYERFAPMDAAGALNASLGASRVRRRHRRRVEPHALHRPRRPARCAAPEPRACSS